MKTIKNYQQICLLLICDCKWIIGLFFLWGITGCATNKSIFDNNTEAAAYYQEVPGADYLNRYVAFDSTLTYLKPIVPHLGLFIPGIVIDRYFYQKNEINIVGHIASARHVYLDFIDSATLVVNEHRIDTGYKVYRCIWNKSNYRGRSSRNCKLFIVNEVVKDQKSFTISFNKKSPYVYVLFWDEGDMGIVYDINFAYKWYSRKHIKDLLQETKYNP